MGVKSLRSSYTGLYPQRFRVKGSLLPGSHQIRNSGCRGYYQRGIAIWQNPSPSSHHGVATPLKAIPDESRVWPFQQVVRYLCLAPSRPSPKPRAHNFHRNPDKLGREGRASQTLGSRPKEGLPRCETLFSSHSLDRRVSNTVPSHSAMPPVCREACRPRKLPGNSETT
jgi:hypothetical protein